MCVPSASHGTPLFVFQLKLWMFPEGTRRNTGEIHSFKKGAFHVAIGGQIPILPIVYSQYYFMDEKQHKFDNGRCSGSGAG